MRGRKPKPSTTKDLQGTARADRQVNEAKPEIVVPNPPAHLSKAAREEWDRIAPELAMHKLISKLDRAALAAYCVAWGRWIEAEDKVREMGLLVRGNDGQPSLNPYLAVADRALKQLREFLVEFGLTPSSRSRINITVSPTKPKGVAKRVR